MRNGTTTRVVAAIALVIAMVFSSGTAMADRTRDREGDRDTVVHRFEWVERFGDMEMYFDTTFELDPDRAPSENETSTIAKGWGDVFGEIALKVLRDLLGGGGGVGGSGGRVCYKTDTKVTPDGTISITMTPIACP